MFYHRRSSEPNALCYNNIFRPYILYSAVYLFTLPIWSSTRSQNFLSTTLTTLDTRLGAGWTCLWMTYFNTCMPPTSQSATTLWSTWPSSVTTTLQPRWLITTEAFSLNHLWTWRTWSWDTDMRIILLLATWPIKEMKTYYKRTKNNLYWTKICNTNQLVSIYWQNANCQTSQTIKKIMNHIH